METMGLNGAIKQEDFPEVIREAKSAQKNKTCVFRHLTGDCKDLKPVDLKRRVR